MHIFSWKRELWIFVLKKFTCQSCDLEESWTVSCRRYLSKTKPDGNLRVSRRSPDLPSCPARWWEAPRWERTGWDSCHRCHGTCEAFWKHTKIENHHLNYACEPRNNRHFFLRFPSFLRYLCKLQLDSKIRGTILGSPLDVGYPLLISNK